VHLGVEVWGAANHQTRYRTTCTADLSCLCAAIKKPVCGGAIEKSGLTDF
jgi:hypothetical protein